MLLHRGWSAFRMIHHDGCLHPGSRTWVEITIAGILPVVLAFEHTVYQPPDRFGEQLVHGPFRKFAHLHEFEEVDTGTRVRDSLDVELPWHYGGELAMKWLIGPMIQRAFRFRGAALLKLAQNGSLGQRAEQQPT